MGMNDEQGRPATAQELHDFFGPPLSCYTRQDALDDELFTDVSRHPVSQRFGLNYPLHLSRALHSRAVAWTERDLIRQGQQDPDARLHDLLRGFALARRLALLTQARSHTLTFTVYAVPSGQTTRDPQPCEVLAELTQHDDGGPLLTFWLADEPRD